MYYLTADGGGTKLLALLYDERFRVLGRGEAGGTNSNFKAESAIKSDMESVLAQCFSSFPSGERPELARADAVIVGPGELFESALRARANVGEFRLHGEGEIGLAAGAGVKHGVFALSGTGSDVFLEQPGYSDVIGGWGDVLGDEGGGYDVGVRALRAAIRSSDGRGERTLLEELVMKRFGASKLWDIVPQIYGSPDRRRLVASAALLVSQAAAEGDGVALGIYRGAGAELALQAEALLRRHGGRWVGPVVAGGGVWKGSRAMFDSFSERLRSAYPEAEPVLSEFEPVVGGAVLAAFSRGERAEEFMPKLRTGFAGWAYKLKG